MRQNPSVVSGSSGSQKEWGCLNVEEFPTIGEGLRLQSGSPGVDSQLKVAVNLEPGTTRWPFSKQGPSKQQNQGETLLFSSRGVAWVHAQLGNVSWKNPPPRWWNLRRSPSSPGTKDTGAHPRSLQSLTYTKMIGCFFSEDLLKSRGHDLSVLGLEMGAPQLYLFTSSKVVQNVFREQKIHRATQRSLHWAQPPTRAVQLFLGKDIWELVQHNPPPEDQKEHQASTKFMDHWELKNS